MNKCGDTSEFLHLEGSLGILALHGGRIEPGTEEIARFVAQQSRASLYVFSGRRSVDNLSLHQPSHRMALQSRPLLFRFLDRVQTAISIHGHGRDQRCVYVGGLHQVMVQRFAELALEAFPQYVWISDPERIPLDIRGLDPNNIVNLPPAHGMQLELPKPLRQSRPTSGEEIHVPTGDALALSHLLVRFVGVMTRGDGRPPDTG